jgi:DNA-binding PucR family transcriptional regulator
VITGPHEVLIADIDDFDEVSTERGEQAAVKVKQRFLDLVRIEMATRAPGSLIAAQSDSVIILIPVRSSQMAIGDIATHLKAAIEDDVSSVTVSVAIGDRTASIGDFSTSYRVARDSLELMRRLGRRSVVVSARDLGAYRLLLKASSPVELRAFAERTLGPLLDPAVRGSADLLMTLRAYLESGLSQRAAARTCSVHVNTVVYRLGRIAETLAVDLADPSDIFNLTLALKIVEVAGAKAPDGPRMRAG